MACNGKNIKWGIIIEKHHHIKFCNPHANSLINLFLTSYICRYLAHYCKHNAPPSLMSIVKICKESCRICDQWPMQARCRDIKSMQRIMLNKRQKHCINLKLRRRRKKTALKTRTRSPAFQPRCHIKIGNKAVEKMQPDNVGVIERWYCWFIENKY